MNEERNYELRYAKAQNFYGYATPAGALFAAAEFDDLHHHNVIGVNLHFDAETTTWGIYVLWEDL